MVKNKKIIVKNKIQPDAYTINGQLYPRMTRVLDIISKPEFRRWYAKNGLDACQKIINDRASFGTRCHTEFEHVINGEPVWVDNEEMRETVSLFKDWKDLHGLKPKHLELTLYNDFLGLAGTCDYIGQMDNSFMLLDWKTSKAIYDTYELQVAGYLFMYEQMHGEILDGCGVVAFRDGKIHEKYLTRDAAYELIPILMSASQLYRWKFNYTWDYRLSSYNQLLTTVMNIRGA